MPGPDREMQVRALAGRRAARVDDDDAQLRPPLLRGHQPAVKDRVAPGEVGADQQDQIGGLEVGVAARHRVGAEGALVAGHGRGHAQARVGVDVGGAEKALGQLVRDVIVLGQQLARDVERHGIRPVRADGGLERGGDGIQRRVPAHPTAGDLGVEQAAFEAQRLAEGGTLGAEPAEIGGVVGVARDLGARGRRPGVASTPQPTPQ